MCGAFNVDSQYLQNLNKKLLNQCVHQDYIAPK